MRSFRKTRNFWVAGTPLYIIFILFFFHLVYRVAFWLVFFLEFSSDQVQSFKLVLFIKFYFSLLSEIMNLEIF